MTWTHNICYNCWEERNPDKPAVQRFNVSLKKVCCFCDGDTRSGITVRHDPNDPILKCNNEAWRHS